MQTAELIEQLSEDGAGASRSDMTIRLLATLLAGCAVSFVAMWMWLGIRADLPAAMLTSAYWMKFVYTLALAAIFFWLTERLGRPGAETAAPRRMVLLPLGAIVGLAIVQLVRAPMPMRMHLMMGASSHVCPWRIVLLSLPVLIAAGIGLRRLAPTRLIAAGLAAGLLAGAAGAWIYAFHCDESASPFVAIWYTLGIACVGAIGGASGKWLLRW